MMPLSRLVLGGLLIINPGFDISAIYVKRLPRISSDSSSQNLQPDSEVRPETDSEYADFMYNQGDTSELGHAQSISSHNSDGFLADSDSDSDIPQQISDQNKTTSRVVPGVHG